MSKSTFQKLNAFYKEFFNAHDNGGIHTLVAVAMWFLMFVNLRYPLRIFYDSPKILVDILFQVFLYSLVAIISYGNRYFVYKEKEYKKTSIYKIVSNFPIAEKEFKLYCISRVLYVVLIVFAVHTILLLIAGATYVKESMIINILAISIFEVIMPMIIYTIYVFLKKIS